MPSILKVKNWYAQSFEVDPLSLIYLTIKELVNFPKPKFSPEVKELLAKASDNGNGGSIGESSAFPAKENPSLSSHKNKKPFQNLRKSQVTGARYYGRVDDYNWPPEVRAYNNNFTKALSVIKRRHDPVVTTMGTLLSSNLCLTIQLKEFLNTRNSDNAPKLIPRSNPSSIAFTCPVSAFEC